MFATIKKSAFYKKLICNKVYIIYKLCNFAHYENRYYIGIARND